jgi:hypothetical protein
MIADNNHIAEYVAQESERLNQSLKEMLANGHIPTDAEKDALLSDMERTLSQLTRALEHLSANLDIPTKEEEDSVA